MAGISIEFNQSDLQSIFDVLERVQHVADDLNPVWHEIGAYFGSETANVFQTETAPDGTPWEETQRSLNEGGAILVDHAHLRDSFTWNVDGDGMGMEFGTNMDYAEYHQNGTRHLPKREMLPDELSTHDRAEVLRIVSNYLERALQR